MRFSFSREELRKAGKFLAGLVVAFFGLSLLAKAIPLEAIEWFVASVALRSLGLFGVSGTLKAGEPVVMQLTGLQNPVAISYLCTGLLETLVLVSAILASFGIPWKERLKGAAGGVLISFIFNIIRIDATILVIRAQGLGVGELTHDWLFRIALFLTVAGYYAWWFRRTTSTKA